MEIRRIDENTIRVQLSREELEERGVNGLDMLSDRHKIQDFFYTILSEIDTDHDFAHDEPVSFQVMPNNGGLDLLISKAKDGGINSLQKMLRGELDDDISNTNSQPVKPGFSDLDSNNDKAGHKQNVAKVNQGFSSHDDNSQEENLNHAYAFNDLDTVIELADNLRANDIASSLYYQRGKYFMEIAFLSEEYSELKPNDAWAIANEYGIKINEKEMNSVKEIGKCLFRQDALGNIRHYFIKPAKI
ncbi:adaptor protein MecA [Lactobacillus hamsteri]|uniref:Competence negative regulator MecA n=1 Tax=Lactobacillus hamsteri DSM 5661 = JCM 6256 TaxID=1423754 RepID=A0A0R1YFA5_9LACO|nr:adaptor protein MecA [Lactobacillus hamsteri]KRM41150.1 competence negative regulator MecA [Lactobacillus hamsteri DSM 5661 = JCM 6256]